MLMNNKIKISDRFIGHGCPVFIIAEAGVNHNGSIELAKKMINVAKESGADAIKFQTFKTENMTIKNAQKAEYQEKATGEGNQYEMLKNLELTDAEFIELAEYAKKKDIIFLSTPFDKPSVDLLEGLGVSAYKIGSGELTNNPLLKYIAEKGKPIILSTGMAYLGEIEDALNVIRETGVENIVLLHCVSSYPTKSEDINLNTIHTLRSAFKLPTGFSDHTIGIIMPIVAVALGACVIEKHFTLDKKLPGPDHSSSLDPDELTLMVKSIKETQVALGNGIIKPTPEEEKNMEVVRKSIVSSMDLQKGSILTEEMIDFKRPGTGISPKFHDKILGKKVKDFIKKDELILWKHLE